MSVSAAWSASTLICPGAEEAPSVPKVMHPPKCPQCVRVMRPVSPMEMAHSGREEVLCIFCAA